MKSVYICPVCNGEFEREDRVYRCINNHCFDISADGHVNLLPANKKHSKMPGDDPEMVRARELFLSAGYYSDLRDALYALLVGFTEKNKAERSVLIDIGCGEGYYTEKLASVPGVCTGAFDISKTAAVKTGKRFGRLSLPSAEAAVASAFSIPVADGTADAVTNVFSPLCLPEISRILRKNGLFLYVVPAAGHLWELKKAIYDSPYENTETSPDYEGFTYIGKTEIRKVITVNSNAHIKALFGMTPYFWHTPKEFAARADNLDSLKTKIEFDIHSYIRN